MHISDSWMSIADRTPDPFPVAPKDRRPVMEADILAFSPVSYHRAEVTVQRSRGVPCLFDAGSAT